MRRGDEQKKIFSLLVIFFAWSVLRVFLVMSSDMTEHLESAKKQLDEH